MHIRKTLAVALGFAWVACNGQATAATIIAPVSAVASSEFISPGHDYDIGNTFDRLGLSAAYQNGVDDFGTYLGTSPTHTSNADGNEWFSRDYSNPKGKIKGLTITYGFGQLTAVDSFALWNDEFAGLGKTKLQYSTDGTNFKTLMKIKPTPSKFAHAGEVVPYLAQVFPFKLTDMLFFRLLINKCPGPPKNESSYRGCGIGEVAFSAIVPPIPDDGSVEPVPLPAALPLLGSALGLFVWMGRRRSKAI